MTDTTVVPSAAAPNGFQRQTLPQLVNKAQTDIEANLSSAVARLPQTNLDALAYMTAGMTDEQLEAIDFYAKQIHVTTATDVWLERHGSEWGIIRKESTRSSGIMVTPVTESTTIPRGTLFQTRERVQVRTTAALVVTGVGQFDVPIEAVELGPTGNLAPRTRLDTVNPIVGVSGTLVGDDGLIGGTPREEDEPYRQRILDRIQEPPQGGAEHDYKAWMLEFPGCTRAWVYPHEQGVGTVICRFVMDNSYPDGIPPAAEVERMLQWLDARRPVTAEVFVYAPVAHRVDVTVRDLNRPPGTQTPTAPPADLAQAVEDELRDMLMREGEPGALLYRSWFWEAVSVAAGSRHHHIDVPADDYQLDRDAIAILGDLEFTYTPLPLRNPRR